MTIQERAEQYADEVSNHGLYEEHGIYDIEVAYKQGHKDAVEIACEWLNDCLPNIEYITNASIYRQDKSKFIDSFKKAIED